MSRLASALGLLSDADAAGEELTLEAPADWAQGRTLYGGMTAALCLEAARRCHPIESPLRSAQFLFVGPAAGRLTFRTELLRQGRSSSTVAVDCKADGQIAARSSFVFANARESAVALPAPERGAMPPPPESCPVFMPRTGGFHDNFDLRLGEGAALFSGGPADFTVWARFRESPQAHPAVALLALADALPPAAMAAFPRPGPISTATWTIDFAALPEEVDGWYLLRSSSEQSVEGYSLQQMALWEPSGRLLAPGRQLVPIFV